MDAGATGRSERAVTSNLKSEVAFQVTNVLYRTLPTDVHADVCRAVGWDAAERVIEDLTERGIAPGGAA